MPAIDDDEQEINNAIEVDTIRASDANAAKEAAAGSAILRTFITSPPINELMALEPISNTPIYY